MNATFETADISVKDIYPNADNFYPQEEIEKKADEILALGLIENLVVTRDPDRDKGEYRLISGERRWRALKKLVDEGHTEYEKVTCQVRAPGSLEEEKVMLIISNSQRKKDAGTVIKEVEALKKILTEMKKKGLTINGRDLSKGEIRDAVADMMNISATKVAKAEAISKRLPDEQKEMLENGEIGFEEAYNISKEPEASICWTCMKYEKCNKKTSFTKECEEFESRKKETAEEKYDRQQKAIDKKIAEKLKEMDTSLPSDKKEKPICLRTGKTIYSKIESGQQLFYLVKTKVKFKPESEVIFAEFKDGSMTGRGLKKKLTEVVENHSGLKDGYQLIGMAQESEKVNVDKDAECI